MTGSGTTPGSSHPSPPTTHTETPPAAAFDQRREGHLDRAGRDEGGLHGGHRGRLSVGPLEPAWPEVRRIAVLRGGGLGDLLFAVPAIESLAVAYPDAEIVLLGTPLHAALFADRPGSVGEVITLPPAKGVHEPGGAPPDEDAQEEFFRRVCRRPVDLAVQLHGGGRWSNPFLLRTGARWTVGARTPDAVPLTRWLPFRYYQHEVMRALEIVGLAGAPPVTLEPTLALTDRDLEAAEQPLRGLPEPLLAVHPSATDPRRRWPPARFADVAAHCAIDGAGVVVLGSPDEKDLVDEVTELTRDRLPAGTARAVRGLTGLDMSALCGVLARSRVLVGNDSGPRHLAKAVGTATVGVFWMGNVINAGPLGRAGDRVLISWTTRCPMCGADCTREDLPRCPHDDSFVADVPTEAVCAEVVDLLAQGVRFSHGR